jgi:uncharacterized protein with PIN domain
MMLAMTMKQNDMWREQQAYCPSCNQRTMFSYAGEQRWPVKVAEAVGIEPVVRLWHCQKCNSTLSECDLE